MLFKANKVEVVPSSKETELYLFLQMAQPEICKVPHFLELEFREDQKLNKVITMENLIDKVISYKIRSNRPQLYLVKPMEGSIYKKDKVKITFIRKALSREDFESYLHSPNPLPLEKFLIDFKYSEQDAVGREKVITQSAYVTVRFHAEVAPSDGSNRIYQQAPSRKKQEEIKALQEKIASKKAELATIVQESRETETRVSKPVRALQLADLIYLGIFAILLGLAL